ncbi:putative gustatory receptor 22c [Hermetia illucens]|uniref:putative gustatory receptor 22c n=1 Tax=Hermetia illucens TaxID=343691 RepID=UPI0018CC77FA|nr:putative gustatory receptor 22c [Hermetia illucens]
MALFKCITYTFLLFMFLYYVFSGILAHSFDHQNFRLKRSKLVVIWGLFVFGLVMFLSTLFIKYVWVAIQNDKRPTIEIISVYLPFIYYCFVILFILVANWWNHNYKLLVFNEIIELTETIDMSGKFKSFALKTVIKHSISLCKATLLVTLFVKNVTNPSNSRSWLAMAYWVYIQLTLEVLMCGFHFTIVLFENLFEVVNEHLIINMCSLKYSLPDTKMCSLSDNIDTILEIHSRLCVAADKINNFNQSLILFVLASGFINLVLRVFITYHTYNTPDFDWISPVYLCSGLINAFVMVNSAQGLLKASKLAQSILLESSGFNKLDVRLERTIEAGSLVLLFNYASTSVGGLFSISMEIFIPFMAGVASFLLILIQFIEYG